MSTIEFYNHFNELDKILNSFAYKLTRDVESARDLFQETAYRALKNKSKFSPGTNFKAWTLTIMKNIFINEYRKRVKENTIFDKTDNTYFIDSSIKTKDPMPESGMMYDEIKSAVDSLEKEFRVPFLMHYQGYKYQEIADYMELPLGTVKSRIFFARKELKQKVKSLYGDLNLAKSIAYRK